MHFYCVTGINRGKVLDNGSSIKACLLGDNTPSLQAIGTQRGTAYKKNGNRGNHHLAYSKHRR